MQGTFRIEIGSGGEVDNRNKGQGAAGLTIKKITKEDH